MPAQVVFKKINNIHLSSSSRINEWYNFGKGKRQSPVYSSRAKAVSSRNIPLLYKNANAIFA
jgi:hypothetical protein